MNHVPERIIAPNVDSVEGARSVTKPLRNCRPVSIALRLILQVKQSADGFQQTVGCAIL